MFVSIKPSILIIDDDVCILRTLTKVFQRKGYNVEVAQLGKEAKEKLSTKLFDVALIDLVLPDMEGTELFPAIQKTSPNTVKIMLTGKMLSQTNIQGADALLQKPIAPEALLSLIDSKLQSRNIEI